MKKIILSIVVVIAITTITNAQNIGATLGANIANVAGDDVEFNDSKFNFTAGLFAEFSISEQLAIQPELVFSGQGYKFSGDDGSGFDVNKAREGIGLKNIDSRVSDINGKAEVFSKIDLGTIIKIEIPV